jgi:hypothetical protein
MGIFFAINFYIELFVKFISGWLSKWSHSKFCPIESLNLFHKFGLLKTQDTSCFAEISSFYARSVPGDKSLQLFTQTFIQNFDGSNLMSEIMVILFYLVISTKKQQ